MAKETTAPMEQTTSHLLVQVCRAHRNKAAELLAVHDLHPGQEFLLYTLWSGDGPTQTELAEELCVQPATLTRMVDRMEKAGWVERQPDADDQRVSRVYLTPAGRALEAPVCEAWSRLEATTSARLSVEERLLLGRLLMQVLDNLG